MVPDIFGRAPHPPYAPTDSALVDTYWGRGSFVESAFYVGVVPLVLAVAAVVKRREPFWIIVLAISVVVAFGAYTPLFKLYEAVPPFNLFRGPSRFLFMATMALAVLAGRGLDEFRRGPTRLYLWTGLIVLLAAVGTVSALRLSLPTVEKFAYGKAEAKAAEEAVASRDENEALIAYRAKAEEMVNRAADAANPLRGPYVVQLAFLGATVILLWTGVKKKPTAGVVVPILLILLTTVDLHYYGRDLNPTTPVHNVREPPATAELVLKGDRGRTFSTGFELADDTRPGLGLIHENTHLIWNLDCAAPRTSLRDKNQLAYFLALEESYTYDTGLLTQQAVRETPTTIAPFSALNVRYFVRRESLDATGVRLLGETGPYKVYANEETAPRAYLLGNAHVEKDTKEAIEYIFSGEFDPAFDLVLERPVDFGEGSISYPVETEIVEYSNNEVVIEYESPAPAVLYFSDLYYPGWRAELDGEPVEIIRANVIGRAVAAPAGRHEVRFYYLPRSFATGLTVTCLFLLVYAGLLVADGLTYGRKKKAI
ncbi:MAG: YfhO family protein [Candidatus Coatesbacteria bacterium]|nr:MAG: YfhO family protein [Candidatus Coatesbacteria bacterium]